MLKLSKKQKNKKSNIIIEEKRFTPWDIMKEIVLLCKNRNKNNFNDLLETLINKVNDKEFNLKYLLNHCLLINSLSIRMNLEKPIMVSSFLDNKEYIRFLVYYLSENCSDLPFYNIFYKLDLKRNIINDTIIEDMEKEDIDYCSELNKTPIELLNIL